MIQSSPPPLAAGRIRDRALAQALIDDIASGRWAVRPGTAGLRAIGRYLDAGGDMFELAVNLHPGARFSHAMTMRLENGAAHGQGA